MVPVTNVTSKPVASSVALIGFGLDSVIEMTSGAALLWRLKTAPWASALGTLLLGIFPSLALDYADKSANLVK